MIHDYKAPSDGEQYLWFWLRMLICGLVFYAGYQTGYLSAQSDYSRPIKYRCHDGVVYKDAMGFWEKINQQCKTHEELK